MKKLNILFILTIFIILTNIVSAYNTSTDIIGYYKLSDLNDQINSYDITNAGSSNENIYPTFNVSDSGTPNSSDFDHLSSEYAYIPDNNDFSFGDGTSDNPFSISAWIYMEDATLFYVTDKSGDVGTNQEYYFGTTGIDDLNCLLFDQNKDNRIGRYMSGGITGYENTWIFVTCTYSGSPPSGNVNIYINGVEVDDTNNVGGSYTAMHNLNVDNQIGRRLTYSTSYSNGNIDELAFWNKELNLTEIQQIYNTGINIYSPPAPITTYFEIYAKSFWDNNSINNFSAIINGTIYTTTNGTINTNINKSLSIIYNITLNSSNWFNETRYNYDTSNNLNQSLKQTQINFSCNEKISGNSLNCVNGTIYPNANIYNFTIGVNGFYNITQEETILALQNNTLNFPGFYSSKLTFINNFITGSGNENTSCNYTLTNPTYPAYSESIIGTNGSLSNLINGTYSLIIDCDDYAFSYENITIENISQSVIIDLYTTNSIDIFIFDETSGLSLNGTNITVTKIIGASQQENHTTTGTISYQNLTAGNYTFSFEGDDYPQRSYSVSIGNKTYQTLNVYLLANTTDKVIFSFEEYTSNQVIEDVTLQISKIINGTDTLIAVLTSDITGRTQFYFDTTERYCFVASKTDYTTKTWCLDPIIFTSYTIKLETSLDLKLGDDFEEILIDWTPKKYWNNQNNTITFTFATPNGDLTNYGFNATYNGSTVSDSGTNAYGELLTKDLEITGSQYGDTVTIWYYYKKTGDTQTRSFKMIYEIHGYDATTDSLLDNPPEDYGLGEFEKTLISVGITILVAGASAYFGGAIAGGVMALFMFSWLMYINFLNFWVGIISLILLFIIISWRSTQ